MFSSSNGKGGKLDALSLSLTTIAIRTFNIDSVAHYGSAVFGFAEYESLVKLHLRAARAFLGLPKNVTSVAIISDMSWLEMKYKTRLNMIRQYHHVIKLTKDRLVRQIYDWDIQFSNNFAEIMTWSKEIKQIFVDNNFLSSFESQIEFPLKSTIKSIQSKMQQAQSKALKIKCSRTFNLLKTLEKVLTIFQNRCHLYKDG